MSEENLITGWVKSYRSLMQKGWYKKSEYFHLWHHLLYKANHTEVEIIFNSKNIILKPGEFITGRKKLSDETGINESKIERILKFFEKNEQQIEQQKTTKNRLIHIINYANYQHVNNELNNKRTTSEQQVNTDKNEKNNNNEKNIPNDAEVFEYFKKVTDDGVFANLQGDEFFDHYTDNGWTYNKGKNQIKNWKAVARKWINRHWNEYSESQRPVEKEEVILDPLRGPDLSNEGVWNPDWVKRNPGYAKK